MEKEDKNIEKNIEPNKSIEKNGGTDESMEKIVETNKKEEKNLKLNQKEEKNLEIKKEEKKVQIIKKEEKNVQIIKKEEKNDEINKKEEIPLLIIDVNIGQGLKKKICVYEGDTAEYLAENFANEYNLDPEMKNRLESLIHNHMQRLLRRDEEENLPNTRKYKNVYRIKSS